MLNRFRRLLWPALFLFSQTLVAQNYNFQLRSHLPYPAGLSNLWGYVDDAANEYALVGADNGLSIVDVTNPDNAVQKFLVPTASSAWHEIKTWNKHAYVTNEGGGGLLIVDLSLLPDTVTYHYFTGQQFKTAHTIWIDEHGVMYLMGYNLTTDVPNNQRGAIMFDLTADPDNPQFIATYNGAYIHDGFVRGDTMWASEINNGQLSVFDVTDKTNFQQLALLTTPLAFTHNAWPTSDNHYLFTTDEKPNSTLTSYDVSNLNNITELDRLQSNPGSNSVVHNAHLLNNDFAAVSYYKDGTIIVDVSQPDNMIQVGAYDTSPLAGPGYEGNWGVYPYLPSGNWVLSDIDSGLFVVSPTLQKAARLQGVVTDSVTNIPVNNVLVSVTGTNNNERTGLDGVYKTGNAAGGTYLITYVVGGYAARTISVDLYNDSIVDLNVKLVPLQGFPLVIQTVDAATNTPTGASQVSITDYGLYQYNVTSDTNGQATVPTVYASEYDAVAGAWGYRTALVDLGNVNSSTGTVTVPLVKGYYDDFYFDFGWTHTQTASTGHWERGVPVGTEFTDNVTYNPGSDVIGDIGAACYVTGNGGGAASDDDVDGGEVVLTSPVFDLTGYIDPYVRYTRWFANGGGNGGAVNDSFVVKLANGTTTATLETVTAQQNANELSTWVTKTFRVSDFLSPSAGMQIRFRAVDASPGHLVEAGVDVFEVLNADQLSVLPTPAHNDWLLYPNPANDRLQILHNGNVAAGSYKLVSVTGSVILSGPLDPTSTSIDIQQLASGYYFIVVKTQNGRAVLHFIKH